MRSSLCIERGFIGMTYTGCDPAKPTVAAYEWMVRETSNCLVHEAGCLSWSSVDADASGSNTSGGMDLLAR